MFTLSEDKRDTLKAMLDAKAQSIPVPLNHFVKSLIPDEIANPERHAKFQQAKRQIGAEPLDDEESNYKTINNNQYMKLHHGLQQVEKLLNGAGINDDSTLLVADGFEHTISVLLKMTQEDAQKLAKQAPNVMETKTQKLAEDLNRRSSRGKMSEKTAEIETEGQRDIQSYIYNTLVDRIHACRTAINVVHSIQAELRRHDLRAPDSRMR